MSDQVEPHQQASSSRSGPNIVSSGAFPLFFFLLASFLTFVACAPPADDTPAAAATEQTLKADGTHSNVYKSKLWSEEEEMRIRNIQWSEEEMAKLRRLAWERGSGHSSSYSLR